MTEETKNDLHLHLSMTLNQKLDMEGIPPKSEGISARGRGGRELMEPEWLAFLREHNPQLYEQAKSERSLACEYRDTRISQLQAENECLKAGAHVMGKELQDLRRIDGCLLDKPEDRMFHAQDGSWWRRDGNRLLRDDCPLQMVWGIWVYDPEGYNSMEEQIVGWQPTEEAAQEAARALQAEVKPCEQCGKIHSVYSAKPLSRDEYLNFQPEKLEEKQKA